MAALWQAPWEELSGELWAEHSVVLSAVLPPPLGPLVHPRWALFVAAGSMVPVLVPLLPASEPVAFWQPAPLSLVLWLLAPPWQEPLLQLPSPLQSLQALLVLVTLLMELSLMFLLLPLT